MTDNIDVLMNGCTLCGKVDERSRRVGFCADSPNCRLPSAADLDAVAEEQRIREATSSKKLTLSQHIDFYARVLWMRQQREATGAMDRADMLFRPLEAPINACANPEHKLLGPMHYKEPSCYESLASNLL